MKKKFHAVFGKMCMLAWPMPSTRRLYKSNPQDFSKMFASMYLALIPMMIIEAIGVRYIWKKFFAEDTPTNAKQNADDEAHGMTVPQLQDLVDRD